MAAAEAIETEPKINAADKAVEILVKMAASPFGSSAPSHSYVICRGI
jgi:hypothetical protein